MLSATRKWLTVDIEIQHSNGWDMDGTPRYHAPVPVKCYITEDDMLLPEEVRITRAMKKIYLPGDTHVALSDAILYNGTWKVASIDTYYDGKTGAKDIYVVHI